MQYLIFAYCNTPNPELFCTLQYIYTGCHKAQVLHSFTGSGSQLCTPAKGENNYCNMILYTPLLQRWSSWPCHTPSVPACSMSLSALVAFAGLGSVLAGAAPRRVCSSCVEEPFLVDLRLQVRHHTNAPTAAADASSADCGGQGRRRC